MSLQDYEKEMAGCSRCSYCKFVPHVLTKHKETSTVCPSIARYSFHGYSGGGKLIAGLALVRGRIDYSEKLVDMVYQCQMCGACDISCKNVRDMEPQEILLELRKKCVEDGQLLPAHMAIVDTLRKEDNMIPDMKKRDRGKWAKGLDVKDLNKKKAEITFHAGCRYSYDEDLWPIVRQGVTLLKQAKEDVGIFGAEEVCCGGRAYQIGYEGELKKYADHNTETWKTAGVKKVVTSCADCYQTFKVLYDKIGEKPSVEILHMTEYFWQLIKTGRIELRTKLPMRVTYHDPCHLGRLAEPWIHWFGTRKYVMGGLYIWDPPREYRRGVKGVYDPPREILKSIPGLTLVEMDRIKEYAWCCGTGGGVKQAFPEFAEWTAIQRLREAEATGAEALVTACPWCVRNFKDAVSKSGSRLRIYDVIELVEKVS